MSDTFHPYPHVPKVYPPGKPAGAGTQHVPVLIVGGGPVGLATALGLARHGVRSVLIEADDGVCTGSRAICISRRSLEIIARLGALEGFLAKGLPWAGGRSFYRDEEVLHFTMPQDANQKLPPMVNLAQYHIEQFLLDAAERQPELIDIRWQTRVTGVEQRADGATVTVATPDETYKIEADWLVAADGGRSAVREALGLKLQGTSYEGRYVIVDIHLKSERPTERLAYFDPPSNPGSTVLVHDVQGLSKLAQRRLDAIQQMEELGSGYYLAMHDLEIRGAGEVLGESQSGEMTEIGFQLYSDMLHEAVRSLKAGKEPDLAAPLASTTEINLHVPALLPADFCGDVHERLSIYKRLANCATPEKIDDIQEELIDRFGKLPDPVKALIETHRLRIAAKTVGIVKIDVHGEAATLQFMAKPPIDPMRIIDLIQKNRHIKLHGQDKLKITAAMPDLAARVTQIKTTIKQLTV